MLQDFLEKTTDAPLKLLSSSKLYIQECSAAGFLNNGISVEQLAQAMQLGKLGEQIVIKSQYAFSKLHFEGAELADKDIYAKLRKDRNKEADELYLKMLEEAGDGLYMQDIMRGGIGNEDSRLPRNVCEQSSGDAG